MALRICLVTPFAWSKPHDVNEHVAGVAQELRALGHAVTILASSNRAADLAAGRAALRAGSAGDGQLIALGPAVPISRRSRVGVPVGARTNLELALESGRFDVVHGFEPALPSLSYLALRHAKSLAVATFLSPERLGYPPGKAQRERFVGRIDALLATSEETARAAGERFPGDYRIVRAVLHEVAALDGWTLTLLRTRTPSTRPYVPRALAGRVEVRTARDGLARAAIFNDAAVFVPAPDGVPRLRLEAAAAGAALASPPRAHEQPQLAAAAMGRLAEDGAYLARRSADARAAAMGESFASVARELESIYEGLRSQRRATRRDADPLANREWIVVDLHMHTNASHDCQVTPALLLEQAEAEGLGAVAVTDHNVFTGAQEAVELARGGDLIVIPGEEVKTDGQGEVIGLFLREEIPRGMTFAETIAAIKEQDGLVYMPHPFDRMHAIPEP